MNQLGQSLPVNQKLTILSYSSLFLYSSFSLIISNHLENDIFVSFVYTFYQKQSKTKYKKLQTQNQKANLIIFKDLIIFNLIKISYFSIILLHEQVILLFISIPFYQLSTNYIFFFINKYKLLTRMTNHAVSFESLNFSEQSQDENFAFVANQPDYFKQWRMKNQITFQQTCPNIGWTNAVLFKPFSKKPSQLMFYLPSYLCMKIKNFKNFQIQQQTSEANVVLILQVYYGDLPLQLIDIFKDKLQIQFSMDDKISCNKDEDGVVIKKVNKKTRTITFTIRTSVTFQLQSREIIFCNPSSNSQNIDQIYQYSKPSKSLEGFKNSLWLSPFELLNQNLFLTFNKVDINISQLNTTMINQFLQSFDLHKNGIYNNTKVQQNLYHELQNIKLMINLMDCEDQHFKINMNSPNQQMLGYYSLAENLLNTRYLHGKVQDQKMSHNYYLEMLILKKNRLKVDLEQEVKQIEQKLKKLTSFNNQPSQLNKLKIQAYSQKLKTAKIKRQNINQLIQAMRRCFEIREKKLLILKKIKLLQQIDEKNCSLKKSLKKKNQQLYSSYYRTQKKIENIQNKQNILSKDLKILYNRLAISQSQFNERYLSGKKNYQETILKYYELSKLNHSQEKKFEQYKQIFQNLRVNIDVQTLENEYYTQPYIEECNQIVKKAKTTSNNKNHMRRIDIMDNLYKKIQGKQSRQRLYFQYAKFNIPVFKNPGVTLLTLFIPLTILTLISLFIYLQDFKDFGARLANIATLMIAYTTYFQIIREKLHKFQDVVLMQILVYLQICSNILCVIQSYLNNQDLNQTNNFQHEQNHFHLSLGRGFSHKLGANFQPNQSDESITPKRAGIFFYISAILLLIVTVFVICAYIYHHFYLRPIYTKGFQFINVCQNEEVTQFTKWYNTQADVYFHRKESRLVPLKKSSRQVNTN